MNISRLKALIAELKNVIESDIWNPGTGKLGSEKVVLRQSQRMGGKLPPEQKQQRPPRPSQRHVWNAAKGQWVDIMGTKR